jgi:hypothetical protein
VSEGGAVGFAPNKVDGAAINACFVQDSALTGQTIAHELCHFLTSPIPSFLDRDGHSRKRGHLLFRTPGPQDIKRRFTRSIHANDYRPVELGYA